ncbi:hypothetical protein [Streptomyces sp. NPDC057287]|uniref:hypothetical protein n=1 Tax=Streptomyces sp. NPDC057287 TaxID=3346086 RepID=UPI00363952C6
MSLTARVYARIGGEIRIDESVPDGTRLEVDFGISGLLPKYVYDFFDARTRASDLGAVYNIGAVGGGVAPGSARSSETSGNWVPRWPRSPPWASSPLSCSWSSTFPDACYAARSRRSEKRVEGWPRRLPQEGNEERHLMPGHGRTGAFAA